MCYMWSCCHRYVKWMMYWIVFALFTSVETFSDFFLSFWFPFYYELKICILIWLLSPATKGEDCLYIQYTCLHREGGGGLIEPKRRGQWYYFTKLGRKYQHD